MVLSGLSGAGKTAATKLFEDLGYVCVDNLPGELLPDLADLIAQEPQRFEHVAIVLDVRAGEVPVAFAAMRGALEGRGIRPQVFFLDARDEVLIRRYSETRHRHPLAGSDGIAAAHRGGAPDARVGPRGGGRHPRHVRAVAARAARADLRQLWHVAEPDQLSIQLISFGYKFGVPLEADLVFDVRFLQNPYYVPELRRLSGLTDGVRTFVLDQPLARRFLTVVHELLALTIPAYLGEGKTRLTIAIGCTGGYHRSIAIAEELARLAHRARVRPGEQSSTASWSGGEAQVNLPALAATRDRGQALARGRLPRTHLAGPGRRARPPPALPRGGGGRSGPGRHLRPDAPVPAVLGAAPPSSSAAGALPPRFGSYRVIRVLLGPFTESAEEPLVDLVYRRRLLARGPRIVAIGGGTGLSTLLRGLKEHTANLTAIVSVADDGGSTGRLREELGIPAVGDIRNCLVALAETEPAMGELLQYRFGLEEGSLSGHAVGNLLIAAMNAIDGGDFEAAVRADEPGPRGARAGRARQRGALTLHARLRDGSEVAGQSRVMRMRGIERVWLEPADVRASPRCARARSRRPTWSSWGPAASTRACCRRSSCPSCGRRSPRRRPSGSTSANVATQAGETEGYDLADHVEALAAHGGGRGPRRGARERSPRRRGPDAEHGVPVRLRWPPVGAARRLRLVLDDVVDPGQPAPPRHRSAWPRPCSGSSGARRGAARRR